MNLLLPTLSHSYEWDGMYCSAVNKKIEMVSGGTKTNFSSFFIMHEF